MTERKAQVAPAELENLVRSLDGVADCAVLGIPHPRAGQVWLLTEHCKHRLFQVPRAVVVKGRENLTVDEVFWQQIHFTYHIRGKENHHDYVG